MDRSLLLVISWFLLFALQHSFTISDVFKAWITRLTGEAWYEAYYRLLFTAANTLILGLLFWGLRGLHNPEVITLPAWGVAALRGVQCLGIGVLILAGRKVDLLEFLGIRQAWHRRPGRPGVGTGGLVRDGIYGRVRHPLYLGGILLIWGEPYLLERRNGLALLILSTLYFYLGSMLEERRMVRRFGEAYRRYQREVPRFIPIRSLFSGPPSGRRGK